MRLKLVLAISVLVAASCGGGNGSSDQTFTGADSGSEILVDTGDRFELRLESNASTGFQWQYDVRSGAGQVELVSASYEEPEDGEVVGAPGVQVFVFEITGSGAGVARLEYLRPFDDPPIPEGVVEFIIRIDGAPWPPDGADDPPSTSTDTAPQPSDRPVVVVGALFDGEGSRDAVVAGFVLWDGGSARLCETLMESFPPQCGGMWVVIADPENLEVTFEPEERGIRWTQAPVELALHYDGDRVFVGDPAAMAPTDDDQAVVDDFVAFANEPTAETAAAVPWADEVGLGLGPDIIERVGRAELADPAVWSIDQAEFRAWSGPFSALDGTAVPLITTIGSHPRCAAPPVPPPSGLENHRRVSIQPDIAGGCIEWWTVDFFIDPDGYIVAITLDLFAP